MRDTILKMLEELGADVSYTDWTSLEVEDNTYISVYFNDFDGFDEDWSEIDREYDDPSKVEKMLNFLEENCSSKEDDFYTRYYFDGFYVKVGYSSYDI